MPGSLTEGYGCGSRAFRFRELSLSAANVWGSLTGRRLNGGKSHRTSAHDKLLVSWGSLRRRKILEICTEGRLWVETGRSLIGAYRLRGSRIVNSL